MNKNEDLVLKKSGSPTDQSISVSRRGFLTTGAMLGAGGALAAGTLAANQLGTKKYGKGQSSQVGGAGHQHHAHAMGMVGTVGDKNRSVNPLHFLNSFNETEFPSLLHGLGREFYRESRLTNGQTLREYLFVALDREIEIAPGIYFPAWTYNGQVPGPTIRANEGERIRIWFINQGSHPHTIHFHGWHPFEHDGSLPEQFVNPTSSMRSQLVDAPFGPGADPAPWLKVDRVELRRSGRDIYEFDANPVGLHLYHCHSFPLKRHIHKGLYGTFIVDPPGGRPKIDPDTHQPLPLDHPVHEMVMVMNGFDTNFDGENEVYAINSIAFQFQVEPIPVRIGDLVRIYLVNITEFDPINSFHRHAGFFRVYRTGTYLHSDEYTDTAMFCQGERAILEMRFREGWPGKYMFHAHQSEFAELGWMGLFDAQERRVKA